MARLRRFGAPRGGGHKRLTEWSTFDPGGFESVSAAGALLMSGLAFENPGTIVRTRGIITIRPADPEADATIAGAFGIGLVSQEAFTAGVASIPEPFTDSDWGGWMVMQPFALTVDVGAASSRLINSMTYEIDSKAMRKVEPNSVMAIVVESLTGAFTIADGTRLLLKLH